MMVAFLILAALAFLMLIVLADHAGRAAAALERIAVVAEAEEHRRDELERDIRAMR